MRKLFLAVATMLALVVSSCSYDDTALWDKVNNHENRIQELERLCGEMNSNIEALETLINAMDKGIYIVSVEPIIENGVEVGHKITFTEGEPVNIYHGKDGKDGEDGVDGTNGTNGIDGTSSVIGVMQDEDGIYYWTLNGEWLTDANGNRIKASAKDGENGANGKDGITPQLKIENDYWYLSMDNGATWTELGKAKGEDGVNYCEFFEKIEEDENFVYFTLIDGSSFKVLKDKAFALELEVDRIEYSAGMTYNVGFTVTGANEQTTMEVIPSNNLRAHVSGYKVEDGIATGYITIEMPKAILEYATVAVIVSDGRSKVLMKAIHFDYGGGDIEQKIIYITNGEAFNFPKEGGQIEVNLQTNISYRVEMEERTAEWLSVGDTRSTLREESLMLYAGENTGEFRHGFVYLVDISNNHIAQIIYVSQNSDEVYYEEVILFADTTFKSYMITNFDLDKDGVVTKGEALSAETITVPTGATDLTGLEYCVNLKSLSLASNTGVTSLDTSTFPLLEILDISKSKVATIDLSRNPRLRKLNVHNSALTALDVAYNNELEYLACPGLSKLTNTTLVLENHPKLTYLDAYNSKLTLLNISGCPELKYLYCHNNALTELYVSKSPKLEEIHMENNSIREIDLSKNTELTIFNCSSNKITSLDMQACMKLYDFTFSSNPLTSLNMGALPRIKSITIYWHSYDYYNISIYGEVIESLKIGGKDGLGQLRIESLYCNTPNLKTLDIGNYVGDEIDFSMVSSVETIELRATENLFDINISNNHNLKSFTLTRTDVNITNQCKNITGIDFSRCTKLQSVSITACPNLASVDFSNNTELQSVSISSCAGITGVDFSNNPELRSVKFTSTSLTSLDLSNNLKVNSITFSSVKSITYLNLGYNTILTSLNPFDTTGPSNITIVAPLLKSLTLTECGGFIDITGCPELTSFTLNPDSTNSMTSFDLSKQTKLKSLTLRDMTALKELDLSHMSELTTLYIRDCSAMQSINVPNIKNLTSATIDNLDALTNVNLTGCSALTTLTCTGNAKLPALNCGGCTSLTSLACYSNSALASLNISDSAVLTTLDCYSCALETLDLSNNAVLTTLRCYSNLLETLDISNNTAITTLDCSPNDNLTTLYMKEGHTISKINSKRDNGYIPAATEIIYVE